MTSSFYITTPIYYVNDVPHLGHAYTTIAADALARFQKMRGRDSYLLTGTDEHGQKIEDAAKERGKTPIELADEVVERFRETWVNLGIAHDDFIRTTEKRHMDVVADIWQRLAANDDIYLGSYDGWYCVSCEAFYPESQLDDGNLCPTHKRKATWVSEPSYFFRMSKYQDKLLEHFEQNPGFVRPEGYKKEILSFINSGLRDLSVSRTSFNWGIPVPDAPEHVIYVWIDALTNYISALGPIDSEGYKRHWPATCHLIGKDILRFHAVYWPCMLLSAKLPLPECILAHGWWTVRGEKISKSMPATRVDPNELAADLGADPLRYYLLREVPLGLDGDFSYEALIGRYNADLANDLGNLLNRTTTMANKFCSKGVPAADPSLSTEAPHAELIEVARTTIRETAAHLDDYAPSKALEAIWRLVRETNRYVDAAQPWKLAKDESKAAELGHTVRIFLEGVYCAAQLVAPVMPATARAILGQLGLDDEHIDSALATWPTADAFLTCLPDGLVVEKGKPLFPRIDDDKREALLAKWLPADALADSPQDNKPENAKPAEAADDDGLISFDDFQKLDFRVAQVISAEPVPKTSKLLRVELDIGDGKPRQVVAGIAEAYPPDDLVGKKVIFLSNLKPATIRGVRSEGMILAAGDKAILGLSAVDADVPVGTKIR